VTLCALRWLGGTRCTVAHQYERDNLQRWQSTVGSRGVAAFGERKAPGHIRELSCLQEMLPTEARAHFLFRSCRVSDVDGSRGSVCVVVFVVFVLRWSPGPVFPDLLLVISPTFGLIVMLVLIAVLCGN